MSFHDQVHWDEEKKALEAARQLQLWCATICPAPNKITAPVHQALYSLAQEMKWEMVDDEVLGMPIIK